MSLVAIIIVGDYHGLWGQTVISKMEIENIHFRATDSVTGSPVIDYHVRCSGLGSNDLCTTGNYKSNALGEKSIKIGLHRRYRKGLIFAHPDTTEKGDVIDIKLWILQTDYHTQTINTNSDELLSYRTEPMRLTLEPRLTNQQE